MLTVWERHCFLPEHNRTKSDGEPQYVKQISQVLKKQLSRQNSLPQHESLTGDVGGGGCLLKHIHGKFLTELPLKEYWMILFLKAVYIHLVTIYVYIEI